MDSFLSILIVVIAAYLAYRVIRHIRKNGYFNGDAFAAHKEGLAAVVAEHNEIKTYTDQIRQQGSFDLGSSSTGRYANLATFQNTSNWNYRRDRNVANYTSTNVHNCSLQVVRNASVEPLKYLMKYFDIKATEARLAEVEALGESISSLENAVSNLQTREQAITRSINPPAFILKHYRQEFMDRVGVELSPITVPYPSYSFEYVSAGGNAGQKTDITLNTETIDALVTTMGDKIRWRKSVAGQRALMTARLREFIKARELYLPAVLHLGLR